MQPEVNGSLNFPDMLALRSRNIDSFPPRVTSNSLVGIGTVNNNLELSK